MAVILFFLPLLQQAVAAAAVELQIQRLGLLAVLVVVRHQLLAVRPLGQAHQGKEIMAVLVVVVVEARLLVAVAVLVQLGQMQLH
jgi:hypothetical protein